MSRDEDGFDTVLAALAADPATAFGRPGARVERLRRIEGVYSSVLQVKIQTPGHSTGAYIKVLKPRMPGAEGLAQIDRMLAREYRATATVHEAMGSDPRIGSVRPLAFFPQHHALVTQEVHGRLLGDLLAEGRLPKAELAALAAGAARWLQVYQSIDPLAAPILIAERREYLDARLKLLEGRVVSGEQRQATLRQFDALARDIGTADVRAVRIHADLTPHNIIVGEHGRVTVLDFTMAKSGTVYHDLAHLYFHLDLLSARHPRRRDAYAAFQASLLETFAPGLSADDPLFRLMLLQHGVCHVAMIAERRLPIVDAAYRWFLRRRWRLCARMPLAPPTLHAA